jgi:hypothetical protein
VRCSVETNHVVLVLRWDCFAVCVCVCVLSHLIAFSSFLYHGRIGANFTTCLVHAAIGQGPDLPDLNLLSHRSLGSLSGACRGLYCCCHPSQKCLNGGFQYCSCVRCSPLSVPIMPRESLGHRLTSRHRHRHRRQRDAVKAPQCSSGRSSHSTEGCGECISRYRASPRECGLHRAASRGRSCSIEIRPVNSPSGHPCRLAAAT